MRALLVVLALVSVFPRLASSHPVTLDGLRPGDPAEKVVALWGRPDAVLADGRWNYADGRFLLVDDATVLLISGHHLVTPQGGEIRVGAAPAESYPGLQSDATDYIQTPPRVFSVQGQPGIVEIAVTADGFVSRIYLVVRP